MKHLFLKKMKLPKYLKLFNLKEALNNGTAQMIVSRNVNCCRWKPLHNECIWYIDSLNSLHASVHDDSTKVLPWRGLDQPGDPSIFYHP